VRRSIAADGINFVLRRGALLHGDVEMIGPEAAKDTGATSTGPFFVEGRDGQQTSSGASNAHWDAADALLDAVAPAPDAMVRLWYRSTSAWMQREHRYSVSHIDHASTLFPNAADILFLSGTHHEVYASPSIQALVQSAVVPARRSLEVRSEREELADAESYFRRAVASDPAMAVARLRLGHVLLTRGRDADAARELSACLPALKEPTQVFFGEMFLGTAEENLKQFDAAESAYSRAIALFPKSQSAALALSELAVKRGDRTTSRRAVADVLNLPSDERARPDPWWDYYTSPARNADALLAELRRPFLAKP
jgi:tetratricopeptide (TPR) repeat protein